MCIRRSLAITNCTHNDVAIVAIIQLKILKYNTDFRWKSQPCYCKTQDMHWERMKSFWRPVEFKTSNPEIYDDWGEVSANGESQGPVITRENV